MCAFVDLQIIAPAKALAAVRALVVSLSTVDQLVSLQVGGVGEGEVTFIAFVGLLFGVGTGVGL